MDISHKWLISYYDICWKSCFKGGFLYVSEGRQIQQQKKQEHQTERLQKKIIRKEMTSCQMFCDFLNRKELVRIILYLRV